MTANDRQLARRFERQTRLADIGADGQAKLCAAKVSTSSSGFAAVIEERYLTAAGVAVSGDGATPGASKALPDLGLRHAAAREVGDGALRALAAIHEVLAGPAPGGGA